MWSEKDGDDENEEDVLHLISTHHGTEGYVNETEIDLCPEWQSESRNTIDDCDHKSFLPLSPVNCKRSILVDLEVGEAAKRRTPYVLRAPLRCCKCG